MRAVDLSFSAISNSVDIRRVRKIKLGSDDFLGPVTGSQRLVFGSPLGPSPPDFGVVADITTATTVIEQFYRSANLVG